MASKDEKIARTARSARGDVAAAGAGATPATARKTTRRPSPVTKRAQPGDVANAEAPRSAAGSDAAPGQAADPRLDTVLDELRGLNRKVEALTPPPLAPDAALDASVDSLRRLLSELLEQRLEAVVRELADVRREAAAIEGDQGARVVERVDAMLEGLGAVRFEAEPMDMVDPFIHVVVDERQHEDAPEGVIVATVRPAIAPHEGSSCARPRSP